MKVSQDYLEEKLQNYYHCTFLSVLCYDNRVSYVSYFFIYYNND